MNTPLITEEIRHWRFVPALIDGVAISATVVLNGNRLVGATRWFWATPPLYSCTDPD